MASDRPRKQTKNTMQEVSKDAMKVNLPVSAHSIGMEELAVRCPQWLGTSLIASTSLVVWVNTSIARI